MKRIAWFAFFLIVAVSCLDEPDCYELNNNIAVVYFKIIGGGTDKIPLLKVISPATDSVILDTLAQRVNLTLNPLDDQTSYSMIMIDGTHDLQLTYKNQVQFVSSDCGERYIFSDLKAFSKTFDSVRVVNPTPFKSTEATASTTNIDVYRCAVTNIMAVKFTAAAAIKSITADYDIPPYESTTPITSIGLPLNFAATTTKFTFDFGGGVVKTIAVAYTITPRTLAAICGEQKFMHNIAATETTGFSAVKNVQDSIHDLPVVNFEITP